MALKPFLQQQSALVLLRPLATATMGQDRHLIIILLVVTRNIARTIVDIMFTSIITHLLKPVVTTSYVSAVDLHHRPRQTST